MIYLKILNILRYIWNLWNIMKYKYYICQEKISKKHHYFYSIILSDVFRNKKNWIRCHNKNDADFCDCLKFSKIKDKFLLRSWFMEKTYLARILADQPFYSFTYIIKNNKLEALSQGSVTSDKWYLKPKKDGGSNGIVILHKKDDFRKYVRPDRTYILQAGIEPMLYNGYKFDIRIFAVGWISENNINFYLYPDGYCRISNTKYDKNNYKKLGNVTNNTFNIKQKGFQANRPFLMSDLPYYNEIFPTIKDNITTTLKLMKKDFTTNYTGYVLYGWDILIDKDLKPWILELNSRMGYILYNKNKKITDMLQEMYGTFVDQFIENHLKKNTQPFSGKWQYLF